jgi:hypothetical protein
MENVENTENKVANSFLADRMAGLVDEVGNPIPQEQTTTPEIKEEEVPQAETPQVETPCIQEPQAEAPQVELTETTPTQEETENQVARIARERGVGVANPPKQ